MMTEGRCTVHFAITAAILFLFVEKSVSQGKQILLLFPVSLSLFLSFSDQVNSKSGCNATKNG